MHPKIKSSKWYGRFWPPERRKVKILQAILDANMPEIQEKVHEAWKLNMVYGLTEQEAIKWVTEHKK